jgi:hypothetical protein
MVAWMRSTLLTSAFLVTHAALGQTFQVAPISVDFGGQSMYTTAPARVVQVTNVGAVPGSPTLSPISVNFPITQQCGTLQPGESCSVAIAFTPASEGSLSDTLTVNLLPGCGRLPCPRPPLGTAVEIQGVGERSLVTHYYRSILRRDPDPAGKAFWLGQASTIASLGADVNEAWYGMAMSFYFSAEYTSFGRTTTEFVRDLYNTFFDREPDPAGLSFWVAQIDGGVPREAALAGFMFSDEFRLFSQRIFGAPAVRSEINLVMDFYRGLLSRMPEPAGFRFWLQQFQLSQCRGGADDVIANVRAVAGSFAHSGEYAAKGRDVPQYVGDLYNGFMRRGADQAGVTFWITSIANGTLSRDTVMDRFIASPEFQARVGKVLAEGCLTTLCDPSLSVAGRLWSYEGGSASFSVTAPSSACSWTAQSDGAPWVVFTRNGDVIDYAVDKNGSTAFRTSGITVRSGVPNAPAIVFTISQQGAPFPVTDTCILGGNCRSNGLCCARGTFGCPDAGGNPHCYPTYNEALTHGCTTVATFCPPP